MALLVAPRTCCCFVCLLTYLICNPPPASFTCVFVRNKVRTWWEQQKSDTSTPPLPQVKILGVLDAIPHWLRENLYSQLRSSPVLGGCLNFLK
jgi:hypothetical protein